MNQVTSPYKILFVDDEVMAIKYFERTVAKIFSVLTADSVDEAIKILAAEHENIGVLITDQRMPGKSGVSLLQHAKEFYPNIPRILTTAYSDVSDAIAAVNSGEILRYVKKPWDAELLKADLRIAMNVFELQKERDELVAAKISVYLRLNVLNRVKDLVAITTSFDADLPGVRSAMHYFLTDALDTLQNNKYLFLDGMDKLEFWHNLLTETERNTILFRNIQRQLKSETEAVAAADGHLHDWFTRNNIPLQGAGAETLNWPANKPYAQMLAALADCDKGGAPVFTVHVNQKLEIRLSASVTENDLWGLLLPEAAISDATGPAYRWLWFYIWASECGLQISLDHPSPHPLGVFLEPLKQARGVADDDWLENVFYQFGELSNA